jgi:diguanylate cyclase (GGDEF)-like protein
VTTPPGEDLRRLASRLIALGAIPIAVFCGAFALARAALGTGQTGQFLSWTLALGAAVAAVFLVARRTAAALDADIGVIREAVRHGEDVAQGEELRELEPPLESLKREVLAFRSELELRESRIQERLDTTRQQVFFLSGHDPLTGLANRKALEGRIEVALASAKSLGSTHALVYFDVDYLYRINDAFGRVAGDELLRGLVPVLQGCLRSEDLLARIGGDEFAVLIENCGTDYALKAGVRIRDAVQSWQFEWEEHAFQVGVSVGVVAITRLSSGLSAIFNEADGACFAAKEQGRNRVVAFHDTEAVQTMRQSSRGWLKRINDAISAGTFTLLYQPIVPIAAVRDPGAPLHVEALLRMSETGGELILPMSFIPVAERYDLMRTIDRWVIERAFTDYRHLARARGVAMPAEFSINLSGHSLSSPDFGDFAREMLARYAVPAEAVCFEITETAAIANEDRARGAIESLRAQGVRFWLDDFGSGLSSFNYLKRFPVDGIKIDGAFVRGLAKSVLDQALVEAIQRVAATMGIATIAESVESAEVAARLRAMGVPWGQGYHFGPPRLIDKVFEEGRLQP